MILANIIGHSDYRDGTIENLNDSEYDQDKCLVEKHDKQNQRVKRKLQTISTYS